MARSTRSQQKEKTGGGSDFSSVTGCLCLFWINGVTFVLGFFPLKEKILSFQLSKALEYLIAQQRELLDTGENPSQVKQRLSELDNLDQRAQVSPIAMENRLVNVDQPLLLVDKGCSLLNIISDKENSSKRLEKGIMACKWEEMRQVDFHVFDGILILRG